MYAVYDSGAVSLYANGYSMQTKKADEFLAAGFKPLLRPLSDLTKEIEHNGEKFVPLKEINYFYRMLESQEQADEIADRMIGNSIPDGTLDYHLMVKLFEWHFDVFGLIEQGKALEK